MPMDHFENKTFNYLIFVFIGIITFFLSGFALQGIHPPTSIYLMFVIYGLLFAGGLLISRKWSLIFIFKAFIASFVSLLLISVAFFPMELIAMNIPKLSKPKNWSLYLMNLLS